MLTNKVYFRVFRLRYRGQHGTCFTIDIGNKQYLITAKHVVEYIVLSDRVDIYHRGKWVELDVVLSGQSNGEIDVAVLRPSIQLSPNYPLKPTLEGIIYGQDAYFLGFPYGLGADIGEINRDFPLPFVKRCVVSMMADSSSGETVIYLDGYNNPGFSGGPVVFCNPAMPPSASNPFKVAAIVKGFRREDEAIYDADQRTHLTYRHNTGIIVTYGINHATDIIQSNPGGLPLPENSSFSE